MEERQSHQYYMKIAIEEAKLAANCDEVPVGAVIVSESGEILSRSHNKREGSCDATAHAEIIAIGLAGDAIEDWNLSGCTIYVTLEPCVMCSGAIVNARIKKLYYGATDHRFGGTKTLYQIPEDKRLNHTVEVKGGLLEEECADLLKRFFAKLRASKS